MKLPRNVSGARLQASLRRLGYETVRQRGSHVRSRRRSTVNIMR